MYDDSRIKLDPILGLPPTGHISDDLKINSMPMVEIIPCIPFFRPGLSIFSLENAWGKYQSLLYYAGYSLSSRPLKLAFLADNFPTDTFSNEYGESFLQKMTDVASEGLASVSQFLGQRSATGLLKEVGEFTKDQGGLIGAVGSAGMGAFNKISDFGKNAVKHGGRIGQAAGQMGNVVNTLLSGARVDFPNVWKNSAYAPSYSMTIRLYNPNPGDLASTKKHIIGPIAAILLLGIPQSENGSTYNWPFLHKVKAPGIYNLDPAFISNIAVIKGGDQQQIGFNQRLAMVDVRIDFGSLFNSILASGGKASGDRPTLRKYLKAMESEKFGVSSREQLGSTPPSVAGDIKEWNLKKIEKERETNLKRLEREKRIDRRLRKIATRARRMNLREKYGLTSFWQVVAIEEGSKTGISVDAARRYVLGSKGREYRSNLAKSSNAKLAMDSLDNTTTNSRVTNNQNLKYVSLYNDMPGDFSLT